MEFFLAIALDPHTRYLIDILSAFIVLSRFIPAFRFFGFIAQGMLVLLQFIRWYANNHPKGRKLSAETNIDEKVDKLLEKHEPQRFVG